MHDVIVARVSKMYSASILVVHVMRSWLTIQNKIIISAREYIIQMGEGPLDNHTLLHKNTLSRSS